MSTNAVNVDPKTHHPEPKYQGLDVPKPRAEWMAKRREEAAKAGRYELLADALCA